MASRALWPGCVALLTAGALFSAHRMWQRGGADARLAPPPRAAGQAAVKLGALAVPRPSASTGSGRSDTDIARGAVEASRGADLAALEASTSFGAASLLIAIRDSGFVCADIVTAARGADEVDVWRVVCDGALVYLVGIDASGRLAADPVPYAEGYRYVSPEPGLPQTIPPEQAPPRFRVAPSPER